MSDKTLCLRDSNAKVIHHIRREVKAARREADEGDSITLHLRELDSDGTFAQEIAASQPLARMLIEEITNLGIAEEDIELQEDKIRIVL